MNHSPEEPYQFINTVNPSGTKPEENPDWEEEFDDWEEPESESDSSDSEDSDDSAWKKNLSERRRKSQEWDEEFGNPSLWNELVRSKDENGKRHSFSDRFSRYTENTVRRQQKEQQAMDRNPVSVRKFLIVLGIIVIIFLLIILTNRSWAVSPEPFSGLTVRYSMAESLRPVFTGLLS